MNFPLKDGSFRTKNIFQIISGKMLNYHTTLVSMSKLQFMIMMQMKNGHSFDFVCIQISWIKYAEKQTFFSVTFR